MKLVRFSVIFFLFLFSQTAWFETSCFPDVLDTQSPAFNSDYAASIGEKVYTVKTEGETSKKIDGVINGIKKNLDNTAYMLIEFREKPLPGAPVFFDDKVIGMVYRQSQTGDLFEVMPVNVILAFAKNLQRAFPDAKRPGDDAQGKTVAEDNISIVKGYIEAQNYDKAVKILRDALKKEPDNAELHGWMGIAMLEMGDAGQAVLEFKRALSIEPGSADFHNGLGYAMLAMESLDEAVVSFKQAILLNPKHADAHYGLGTAYVNLGEIKLATKEYVLLKDMDGKMADRLFQLIMRRGGTETE
ncbi:MAG: tetratricopeptide repeat protein [Nitrospirae bacterium]|nr:MAG: tetratricopeptide repeat protein [Nitrospirota bacterium]